MQTDSPRTPWQLHVATEHLKCSRSKMRCVISMKGHIRIQRLSMIKRMGSYLVNAFLYRLHVEIITFGIYWVK